MSVKDYDGDITGADLTSRRIDPDNIPQGTPQPIGTTVPWVQSYRIIELEKENERLQKKIGFLEGEVKILKDELDVRDLDKYLGLKQRDNSDYFKALKNRNRYKALTNFSTEQVDALINQHGFDRLIELLTIFMNKKTEEIK